MHETEITCSEDYERWLETEEYVSVKYLSKERRDLHMMLYRQQKENEEFERYMVAVREDEAKNKGK